VPRTASRIPPVFRFPSAGTCRISNSEANRLGSEDPAAGAKLDNRPAVVVWTRSPAVPFAAVPVDPPGTGEVPGVPPSSAGRTSTRPGDPFPERPDSRSTLTRSPTVKKAFPSSTALLPRASIQIIWFLISTTRARTDRRPAKKPGSDSTREKRADRPASGRTGGVVRSGGTTFMPFYIGGPFPIG